jgi:hypothetical protein
VLWYGFKNKNSINKISRQLSNKNLLTKRYSRPHFFKKQLNKQNFRMHKPFGWELLILKPKNCIQKNIILLSNTYLIKIPLPTGFENLSVDPNTNVIKLHFFYVNNNYRLFYHVLTSVLRSFYVPTFLKIKFKGKGYYIYKGRRNTITPQFGYAHRLYLYSYFISVKFLSKTSILLFGFQQNDLIKVGLGLKSMRPINIFTGRGVRFARQVIYKKVGKVSSYR